MRGVRPSMAPARAKLYPRIGTGKEIGAKGCPLEFPSGSKFVNDTPWHRAIGESLEDESSSPGTAAESGSERIFCNLHSLRRCLT
jgi:hypothetical protein